MHRIKALIAAVAAGALASAGVAAREQPAVKPSMVDSFRLGSGGTSLCQVQALSNDASLRSIFDRAFAIACRDAAAPVGHVYALRGDGGEPFSWLPPLDCQPASGAALEGVGNALVAQCTEAKGEVPWKRYQVRRGHTVYFAQGLAGYDPALRLALRSIVLDKVLPGDVSIAVTEAGDAASFARMQAGSLDPDQALAEGYRRNNGGNYAEAAEFFDILLQRRLTSADPNRHYGEYIVNQALQKSNLGDFAEADALFAEAHRIPTADPVELRLRRNLEAINDLNQNRLDQALGVLNTPIAPIGLDRTQGATIDKATAQAINSDTPLGQELGLAATATLTPPEKAAILDAQALGLRGTIFRLQGKRVAARADFNQMLADINHIRGGNIASLARLRAQIYGELAALDESEGNRAQAESLLRQAVGLLDSEYPGSAAVNAAKARLAAFLARTGRDPEAIAIYRQVVDSASNSGGTGYEGLLAPYFVLLARDMPAHPELAGDFFAASQTMIRPGLAETQAILSRELSAGDDKAAGLFRQSVALAREVERQRVELARLAGIEKPTPVDLAGITQGRDKLAQLQVDQAAMQAQLSQFPRYRAISRRGATLAELQAALKPNEAYWKLLVAGGRLFGFFATHDAARAWEVPMRAAELETIVDAIRASITRTVNGEVETIPFDLVDARKLYVALAGPEGDALPSVHHLIFEPDGAMLRLPANLLVTDDASVRHYQAQAAAKNGDPFDFRGVAWLGRSARISTAVSARSFLDVRQTPPSHAREAYLGFGHNAPVPPMMQLTAAHPMVAGRIDCSWPLSAWSHPISPDELFTAEKVIGKDHSKLVTGAAFSDTAIKHEDDLDQYRIIHFATHGLVGAPKPACPAQPALLTSFGGGSSDGLLTFSEIYDLHLDADLVILSACNTAGAATVSATREAGIVSGGGRALDGLVRAFVGAGSRAVLATHWPAPDDYHATERLISGLFEAPRGTPIATALQDAQKKLMDDEDTSHPYYWSAFALVGDGAQPLLRAH